MHSEHKPRSSNPAIPYHQGREAAKRLVIAVSPNKRLATARSFCAAVVEGYWSVLCYRHECTWQLPAAPGAGERLSPDAVELAQVLVRSIGAHSPVDAGFMIGGIYTVMLPNDVRAELGAHYTPGDRCTYQVPISRAFARSLTRP